MARHALFQACSTALLNDLYQLTMAQGYWLLGRAEDTAAFSLTFRQPPFQGGYAIAAGLASVIDFIDHFRFHEDDLEYLASLQGNDGKAMFGAAFLDYLRQMRLELTVEAAVEGSVVFAHEPILTVTGPLPQCQLMETPLLTLVNFPTLIATKAARMCHAAKGDAVIEFGLRRAQGIDGGLTEARAAYLGGCVGTANVLAAKRFGIPVKGTHAHSWVMSFDDEQKAFEAYARVMPNNALFLVDTYNTINGLHHAAEVGKQLQARGHRMIGIRLDSGDLADLSIKARQILDEAGLPDAQILASNELDEALIRDLKNQGAKIDLWGVGTKLATAWDQPALGGVYKLSALRHHGQADFQDTIKLSEQTVKINTPGLLRVRRYSDPNQHGRLIGDMVYDRRAEPGQRPTMINAADPTFRMTPGANLTREALLSPIYDEGRRVYDPPPLAQSRQHRADQLARLAPATQRLRNPTPYPVGLEQSLHEHKMNLIIEARHHYQTQ